MSGFESSNYLTCRDFACGPMGPIRCETCKQIPHRIKASEYYEWAGCLVCECTPDLLWYVLCRICPRVRSRWTRPWQLNRHAKSPGHIQASSAACDGDHQVADEQKVDDNVTETMVSDSSSYTLMVCRCELLVNKNLLQYSSNTVLLALQFTLPII